MNKNKSKLEHYSIRNYETIHQVLIYFIAIFLHFPLPLLHSSSITSSSLPTTSPAHPPPTPRTTTVLVSSSRADRFISSRVEGVQVPRRSGHSMRQRAGGRRGREGERGGGREGRRLDEYLFVITLCKHIHKNHNAQQKCI